MTGTTASMTGVIACEGRPHSAAWFRARREGITATDISALTGRNKWKTPLDIWLAKTRDERGSVGEAAHWGLAHEATILRHYRKIHKPVIVTRPNRFGSIIANADQPLIRASLDAIGEHSGFVEVVEVKTAGSRVADQWADGTAPPMYVEQVQWQMLATGIDRARICVLIGGNQYEERIVHADAVWQADASALAVDWWDRHIVAGERPTIDPARDTDTMNTLYDPQPDETTDLDPDLWDRYVAAATAATDATKQVAETRILIQEALGESCTGTIDGEQVVTWNPRKPVATFDRKRWATDHPDLVDMYLKQGKPGRTFRPTPIKGDTK